VDRAALLKTSDDIQAIRRACAAAVALVGWLSRLIEPGVTTAELDGAAAAWMRRRGARPAVAAGFPGSVCLSVNEVAAHGVPLPRPLQAGDLVTVDVSLRLGGWCGDAAWTFAVGEAGEAGARLLQAAREALGAGVAAVRAGTHLGDVGAAIAGAAARRGCRVLPELVGHGIGRALHEEPAVPPTGTPGEGGRIVAGMVLTVEPALTMGDPETLTREDGWSVAVRDGAAVVQLEHTLAVFRDRTEVLTTGLEEAAGAVGRA
jgi:methionyl aminopeptidase